MKTYSALGDGRFARAFRERYLRSLRDYRFFYDDVNEIGNADSAEHVFYFVPGINGTPGQMRFVLPSLTRVFGSRIYLKALHLPEFSAHRPTWQKYTPANLDLKIARLRADLVALLARHPRVTVIASSNGFYDFAAAASSLPPDALRDRVQLLWGACAPDHFEPTIWERVFYPISGFQHAGHRWFAAPNHNALHAFNPETSTSYHWRDGAHRRHFVKADLESRFHFLGLQWSYVSTSQLGAAVRHVVKQIRAPLDLPAAALVAANDGYWRGLPPDTVEGTIRRYLPDCEVVFKPASHLWVVTPTYVTELLARMKARSFPAEVERLDPKPLRSGSASLPSGTPARRGAATFEPTAWGQVYPPLAAPKATWAVPPPATFSS